MADVKITALPAHAGVADADDLVAGVDDPSGSPVTQKFTFEQALGAIGSLAQKSSPTTSDEVVIADAADSGSPKRATISALLDAAVVSSGENYVILQATSATATDNGTALSTAYTAAKLTTPYGSALSETNRFTILLTPGIYDLAALSLTMDNQFVDIVGWNSNFFNRRRVNAGSVDILQVNPVITSSNTTATVDKTVKGICLANLDIQNSSSGTVLNMVTADTTQVNVAVSVASSSGDGHTTGIDVAGYWEDCYCDTTNGFGGDTGGVSSGVFVRCRGSSQCFGNSGTASGLYLDCDCERGFANLGTASGTFVRCSGGRVNDTVTTTGSFAARGTASGTFLWCDAPVGNGSFGGSDASSSTGTASGFFFHCRASGGGSFGGNNSSSGSGNATGEFFHCVSEGNRSFGYRVGSVTGLFAWCRSEDFSFSADSGGGSFAGTAICCTGGDECFGGDGADLSGDCYFCVAGNDSFAGDGGDLSGNCYFCAGGVGCFSGDQSGSGTGGILSGACFGCHAGNRSFASSNTGGTLSGECFHCRCDGEVAFGSGDTTKGVMSGRLTNCRWTGRLHAEVSGTIEFCAIEAAGTNEDGITDVRTGVVIRHCTVKATGTGLSIDSDAGAAQNVSIYLCAVNTAFGTDVNNLVSTPYVVQDTNI